MLTPQMGFLRALFGEEHEGYVAVHTWPEGLYSPSKGPTECTWFHWPRDRNKTTQWMNQKSAIDILVRPVLFEKETLAGGYDNVAHQPVLTADAGLMDVSEFRMAPSFQVETSPGRIQVYWLLEKSTPKRIERLAAAMTAAHRTKGCAWVSGVKMVRVPGTRNSAFSHLGGVVSQHVQVSGRRHDIRELERRYQLKDAEIDAMEAPSSIPMPQEDWADKEEAANWMKDHAEVAGLYGIRMDKGTGDRSRLLWRLLHTLRRADAPVRVAMRIAWDAGCCTYRLDGKGIEPLWDDLRKAWAEVEPVTESAESERTRSAEAFAKEISTRVAFLSADERRMLPEDTLVDRYMSWATKKTGGISPQFHRTGIMTVLSVVLGEFGDCPTPFPLNLTLWFITVGPTTRSRKSTAQRLWVELLKTLEDPLPSEDELADGMDEGVNYNIVSDVTGEALARDLLQRPGLSTLFYRDEAHGMLVEQKNKQFLAGLREHFTELYDGNVRTRVRVGHSNQPTAPRMRECRTNFVVHLCGTMDGLSTALTTEDFASGHMPRFLVAHSEGVPLTRDMLYVEQAKITRRTLDEELGLLSDELKDIRAFWMDKTERGDPLMIHFTDEAWERWNDLNWQITETAQSSDMVDVLGPVADRMAKSVIKAAVLLAMSAKKMTVELVDVLQATAMCEEWFRSMATLAGKIRSTALLREQDLILDYIEESSNGRTRDEVIRKFRGNFPNPMALDSVVRQLQDAGLITALGGAQARSTGNTRYLRTAVPR